MSSRREDQRLLDIIENSDAVAEYIEDMPFDSFVKDRKTIDAVERCLMRITEAAIKIGEERMQIIAPALPLYAVRGLGNILRHEYDQIDMKSIFVTLTEHLPTLRAACPRTLDQPQ
ncbi:MAG: HepT-like ribonuclease domain-containing protein [Sphingobium sp.]